MLEKLQNTVRFILYNLHFNHFYSGSQPSPTSLVILPGFLTYQIDAAFSWDTSFLFESVKSAR